MISVTAYRDAAGQLCRLRVCGHAGAAPKGHDIICAAVSALVQTLQNGLDDYLGSRTHTHERDARAGVMDFSWSPTAGQGPLTESILDSLQAIAHQEPDFLTYSEVS